MSKEISTIGRVWLIIMGILATIGVVTNLIATTKGIVYLVSAAACVAELVGVVFMLKGKGLVYFCLYSVGYVVNAVLVALVSSQVTASWFVGFVIGVCINIGLTYLAAKKTISFKK